MSSVLTLQEVGMLAIGKGHHRAVENMHCIDKFPVSMPNIFNFIRVSDSCAEKDSLESWHAQSLFRYTHGLAQYSVMSY